MGHEYAGTVAAIGEEVDGLSVVDKEIKEPIRRCGDCFQCKNGSNVCKNFSITGMHTDGGVRGVPVLRDLQTGVLVRPAGCVSGAQTERVQQK
nr:alcohol dehydrogenase catalytic domain-containing protein [Natronoarchaeum philippinense]